MRRIFSLLIVTFLLIAVESHAQRIQGALIGGMNIAQVDGDEIFGYSKIGANTGLGALVPLGNSMFFSIETLFSQKGSYQSRQYTDEDSLGNELTGQYNLTLSYLEVPFLFLYNDKDVVTGGVGFSYGRLVNISEYEHGRKVETSTLNSGPYDRNEFSLLGDIRFRIYKKLKINLRYAYSIPKIRTRMFTNFKGDTWNRKQYNNVISLRLVYMFNEKPPVIDVKNDDGGF